MENQSSNKVCKDGEEGRKITPQVRFVRMEKRMGCVKREQIYIFS